MVEEFSWYIEDNRYRDFIKEADSLCDLYVSHLSSDDYAEKKEAYEKLYEFLSFYLKKAAIYKIDLDEYIMSTLFRDGRLDYDELHSLEKRIIQGCMYEANLYKYMGTVGLYTQVSKSALLKSGGKWEDLLPSSYKEKLAEKSPISNILKNEKNAVAIYAYPDGNISTEYKSADAKLNFRNLEDNSGFDFTKKGYDVNYEIQKTSSEMQKTDRLKIDINQNKSFAIEDYFEMLESGEEISLELLFTDEGIIIINQAKTNYCQERSYGIIC